jgi:hypothetical protein
MSADLRAFLECYEAHCAGLDDGRQITFSGDRWAVGSLPRDYYEAGWSRGARESAGRLYREKQGTQQRYPTLNEEPFSVWSEGFDLPG